MTTFTRDRPVRPAYRDLRNLLSPSYMNFSPGSHFLIQHRKYFIFFISVSFYIFFSLRFLFPLFSYLFFIIFQNTYLFTLSLHCRSGQK
jgi:hypothetical protein